MKPKGYIHIYTGHGKGKTTAALGLALRAAGAGLKTCFVQLMKGRPTAETRLLRTLPGLTLKRFGCRHWVVRPTPTDRQAAAAGFKAVCNALTCGRYDLVIGDELCTAVSAGLIDEHQVLACLRAKPQDVELVLTGRGAGAALRRAADLVTVMRPAKHYFDRGVAARKGIEY